LIKFGKEGIDGMLNEGIDGIEGMDGIDILGMCCEMFGR
jgi:hypothetical protein